MRVVTDFPLIDGPLAYKQPQGARGVASFLTDGPAIFAGSRRREVLGRMADSVFEHEAYGSLDDARRLLHSLRHYDWLDVALLAPEALILARQFVETQGMVAEQMMDSST